jgi:hypothetical protein
MYNTNLMAVQEEGRKLVMMDGTIWIINPDDIKKTIRWIPPCGIQIDAIIGMAEYDYTIINIDENITATAQKRR